MVELGCDVACQFQMLFLIIPDRHMCRVIEQYVRSHQRRIGKQPDRGILGVFARLILELGHALHPSHTGHAVKHPRKLCMFFYRRLIKDDGFRRIQTRCQIGSRNFTDLIAQCFGILPDGDGVQINNTINCFVIFVLHINKTFQCTQVIPKRQRSGGLNTRKNALCKITIGWRLDRIRHFLFSVWNLC